MKRAIVMALLLAGCPTKREEQTSERPAGEREFDSPTPIAQGGDDSAQAEAEAEGAHHVVFADRTSQAYLLLLDDPDAKAPTRDELAALVHEHLEGASQETEVALLDRLIHSVPPPPGFDGLPEEEKARLMHEDLLGLHIEMLPVAPPGKEPLISPEVLTAEVLTQGLSPVERASATRRPQALLLRAEYRNQYSVRGLRLLQTLVRLVAADRHALIHDPDTFETMNVAEFTQRRLRASIGNIADQLAVVPFPGDVDDTVRLTTRGMRRFGSVDLELDGLPADPAVLERATVLLVGLAYKMVRLGEFADEGFAVEVDDEIELTRNDIQQAYSGRAAKLPDCGDCPGRIRVHLVERPAKETDPADHVVAQVVAPRDKSDDGEYDHRAWTDKALSDLVGK